MRRRRRFTWWPLAWRSTLDRELAENRLLLEALRDANMELARHRTLVARIKSPQTRDLTLAQIDGRIH